MGRVFKNLYKLATGLQTNPAKQNEIVFIFMTMLILDSKDAFLEIQKPGRLARINNVPTSKQPSARTWFKNTNKKKSRECFTAELCQNSFVQPCSFSCIVHCSCACQIFLWVTSSLLFKKVLKKCGHPPSKTEKHKIIGSFKHDQPVLTF